MDKNHTYTFGCDVYPFLELDKRANQDKIDPVAPGGKGRWRYMGVHRGLGGESRGGLIFDTKTRRMRVMKNFKVNEDMAQVRELPEPTCMWGDSEEDDSSGADSEDSDGGEKVQVLLREERTADMDSDNDMPDLAPPSGSDNGDERQTEAETKDDGGVTTPAKKRGRAH